MQYQFAIIVWTSTCSYKCMQLEIYVNSQAQKLYLYYDHVLISTYLSIKQVFRIHIEKCHSSLFSICSRFSRGRLKRGLTFSLSVYYILDLRMLNYYVTKKTNFHRISRPTALSRGNFPTEMR